MLTRSSLCALALMVAVPVAGGAKAEAGGRLVFGIEHHSSLSRADVSTSGKSTPVKYGQCWVFAGVLSSLAPSGSAATAVASVKSDSGSEDITLAETDAWLHGSAGIGALPKKQATLALTLYDKGSAPLASFTGTLGTDGAVSLEADDTKATRDLEVLAGEVFGASGSQELAVDLAGADTDLVAYATVTVNDGSTTTKAEVGWDDLGAVWTGDVTLAHEGIVDVKVKSYDSKGTALESSKAALGNPWRDDGVGTITLGVDEDPLTRLGLLGHRIDVLPSGAVSWVASRLAITSEGWSASTVPVSASLELTGGGTITLTAPTYLRLRKRPELLYQAWETAVSDYISDILSNPLSPTEVSQYNPLSGLDGRLKITGGSVVFVDHSLASLGESPICASGACFMVVDDGAGAYELAVSLYGSDASKLADELELTVTLTDEDGNTVLSDTDAMAFEEDITAVFAREATFGTDPLGLDLAGKLSLLGAADKKGKQATLAKGKFQGSFSRDDDGDLNLGGADKDTVTSSGSVVVAGANVSPEVTDTNKDGVVDGPALTLVTPLFGSSSARVVAVRRGQRIDERHFKK